MFNLTTSQVAPTFYTIEILTKKEMGKRRQTHIESHVQRLALHLLPVNFCEPPNNPKLQQFFLSLVIINK